MNNETMNKDYSNTRIEYHIIQSFPVTCLNRDDVGAPKTAIVGGVTRARVSSQSWKRQVRMAMHELGVRLGIRTKKVVELLERACVAAGANEDQARACATKMASVLADDTLLFITATEAAAFAGYAVELAFDDSKIKDKELARVVKKALDPAVDGLDIALFGRMVAKAPGMNLEAAASFAHAISTHKTSNEVEFFTALDDLQQDPGSAHMGSLEFNAATYYRYVCLDIGQLAQTIGSDEDHLAKAIDAFTRALFIAIPAARQTTQSGASPWEFARILVRNGQRLQVPFETPVKPEQGGFLQPSVDTMKQYLDKKEKLMGSMFGKLGCYEWGEDESYNIDDLVNDLKIHVQ